MNIPHPHASYRPIIWLSRFRHRRGYGVHSPFAFEYITRVCNETTPYYKYKELAQTEKEQKPAHEKSWAKSEPLKVKRLLFRMVNRAQPQTLVETGTPTAASLYLRAAKDAMKVLHVQTLEEAESLPDLTIDFLYLRHAEVEKMRQLFDRCLTKIAPHSVVAVQGIHRGRRMKKLWKAMRQEAVVTFDLYDVGILFFDENYYKQDYIVNF